jgi:hypothetical protein
MKEDRAPFPTSDLVGFGDITYMNEDREATMRAALVEARETISLLRGTALMFIGTETSAYKTNIAPAQRTLDRIDAALNAGGEGDGTRVKP